MQFFGVPSPAIERSVGITAQSSKRLFREVFPNGLNIIAGYNNLESAKCWNFWCARRTPAIVFLV